MIISYKNAIASCFIFYSCVGFAASDYFQENRNKKLEKMSKEAQKKSCDFWARFYVEQRILSADKDETKLRPLIGKAVDNLSFNRYDLFDKAGIKPDSYGVIYAVANQNKNALRWYKSCGINLASGYQYAKNNKNLEMQEFIQSLDQK